MKLGKGRSSWQACAGALLALLMCAPGCALKRAQVETNLMGQRNSDPAAVAQCYRVGCPDVVEIAVANRDEIGGRLQIAADGRVDLGDYGDLRVEGRTPAEIAKLIGEETGASPEDVDVRVVEHRSQHVLLFGEVAGRQRSVSYRGPETVLELLQRVGGITPGAAPNDVYVLRPHLGDNQRPEVFHVDLNAIVLNRDHKTNLRILPYDQIYVGETRKAQIEKAIPPWARGVYQAIWGTRESSLNVRAAPRER